MSRVVSLVVAFALAASAASAQSLGAAGNFGVLGDHLRDPHAVMGRTVPSAAPVFVRVFVKRPFAPDVRGSGC